VSKAKKKGGDKEKQLPDPTATGIHGYIDIIYVYISIHTYINVLINR